MLFKKTTSVDRVLSFEELKSLVGKLSFYSQWVFSLRRLSSDEPQSDKWDYLLLLEIDTVDALDGVTLATVEQPTYVSADITESEFLLTIWRAIDNLERHERLEILKLDGKQIWLPHTVDKKGAMTSETVPHNKVSYA